MLSYEMLLKNVCREKIQMTVSDRKNIFKRYCKIPFISLLPAY